MTRAVGPVGRSAGMRQVVLFGMFFLMLLLTALAGELLMKTRLEQRTALLLTSAVQCVLAFCVPAYVAARFSSESPWRFLGLRPTSSWRPYAGVAAVYVIALPAMNQIIDWNAHMHFPEWAAGLERQLRELEEANAGVGETLLSGSGFWQMLAAVAVVGLLTGFSEELFFRGALQGIYLRTGCAAWIAVWGAAAIFSAVHFQFFGFVPRLLMGGFFGWLLVWTGSLWPAVAAHALNNTAVVVATWWTGGDGTASLDGLGVACDGAFPWEAAVSAALTTAFFVLFRKYFFKPNGGSCHGKEN